MLAVTTSLPHPVDTVRPVSDAGGQIGEHRTRIMGPRAPEGIRQHRGDLRRQPGQLRHLAQHPHPGVRHDTMTVGGHFHPRNRCDTLHLRSAFPLALWNPREVPLCLAGQALSLIYTPRPRQFREKSRLGMTSAVRNASEPLLQLGKHTSSFRGDSSVPDDRRTHTARRGRFLTCH